MATEPAGGYWKEAAPLTDEGLTALGEAGSSKLAESSTSQFHRGANLEKKLDGNFKLANAETPRKLAHRASEDIISKRVTEGNALCLQTPPQTYSAHDFPSAWPFSSRVRSAT